MCHDRHHCTRSTVRNCGIVKQDQHLKEEERDDKVYLHDGSFVSNSFSNSKQNSERHAE